MNTGAGENINMKDYKDLNSFVAMFSIEQWLMLCENREFNDFFMENNLEEMERVANELLDKENELLLKILSKKYSC